MPPCSNQEFTAMCGGWAVVQQASGELKAGSEVPHVYCGSSSTSKVASKDYSQGRQATCSSQASSVTSTMSPVQPCEVPVNSLLSRYGGSAGYADCYVIEVEGVVTQAAFIEAFYTGTLFKVERTLLKYLASKPATDQDARQLAVGKASTFSAWSVESQSETELLLADFSGRTRSWLMVAPGAQRAPATSTLLYFGSAVVPPKRAGSGQAGMSWLFHALLGFHRLYSRLLLSAASKRIARA